MVNNHHLELFGKKYGCYSELSMCQPELFFHHKHLLTNSHILPFMRRRRRKKTKLIFHKLRKRKNNINLEYNVLVEDY